MPDLLVEGDFIQHKYQVEKVIYSDKDVAVYKCKYHNEYRVVKQIFSAGDKEKGRNLFLDRCEILKDIDHKNLACIEDFFVEDRVCFVVMEDVKGRSLEDIYKKDYKGKLFDSAELMKNILEVCEGLLHLHSQDPPVIFGNLSPRAVIVDDKGEVKLVNYGLNNIAKSGRNTGEKGFSSPEQDKEKDGLPGSDIYSLGALMYFLLSGKHFDIKKSKPLRSYNRKVPRGLDKLIRNCLLEKSSDRPDIEKLSKDLSKVYLKETMRMATRLPVPQKEEEPVEEEKEDAIEEKEEKTKAKKKKKSLTGEVKKEEAEEKEEISKKKSELDEIKESEEAEEEAEEKTKKKKKKKKKKKSVTDEVKKEVLKEESEEVEDTEEKAKKKKKKKKKKSLTAESVKEEKEEAEEEAEEKTKKKKKKKKKKKSTTDKVEKEREDEEEVIDEADDIDESDEDGFDDFSDDDDLEEDRPEKASRKKRKRSTSRLSQMLVSAIKQKEEEEALEEAEDGEEQEEEAEEEKAEEEKTEEAPEKVPAQEEKAKGAPGEDVSSRSASIASFLRMKSGLSDEAYEVNKDLLASRKKRKTGLSEEFLASLKVTSMPTGSLKDPGEKIKEARFAPYVKPAYPPPMPLYEEIDRLKNDRYEVGELLNKDCCGAVYIIQDYDEKEEGKDKKILKEIQYKGKDCEVTAKIAAKFQQVAEKLKSLDHPGLASVTDYFYELSEDKLSVKLCLIREYIEGETFEEMSLSYYNENKKSEEPAKKLHKFIKDINSAIEYLHDNGIVYGDLRPSNIFITSDEKFKCVNYGLAEIFKGLEDDVYPFKGTYGYVAPELLCLPDADARSDIFSLGATMYFVLTRQNPENIKYKFIPIRKYSSFLTAQIDRFIHTCLNFTPSHRPDIKQIGRVITGIKFFGPAKDTQRITGSLDEPPEEEVVEEVKPLETVKDNISSAVTTIKKYYIVAGAGAFILLLAVLVVFWVAGHISSLTVSKDLAYVIQKKSGLFALNMKTEEIAKEFEFGECRSNLAYSGSRKELYVLSAVARLLIIDLTKVKLKDVIVLREIAYGIAISDDEKTLYYSCPTSSEVVAYSLDENKEKISLVVGESPGDLLCLSSEYLLLVSDFKANKVHFISTKTNETGFSLDVGKAPMRMAFNKAKKFAYVGNWKSNDVSVINLTSRKVVGTIPVGKNPSGLAISPDNNYLYVSNQESQSISLINADTAHIIKEIKVEGDPYNIIPSNDGKKLYICLKGDKNKISILNALTFAKDRDIILTGKGGNPLNILVPENI